MVNPLSKVEIPKRSQKCCEGGERLDPGMDYYSFLLTDENQKIIRKDYCVACWRQMPKERQEAHGKSYWKSRIEVKKEENSQGRTRLARALSLLKKMLEQPENQEPEIFVLSLFLAHKRLLTARKELQRENKTYHLYEIVGEDRFLTIPKLDLSQFDSSAVQRSLSKQLNAC